MRKRFKILKSTNPTPLIKSQLVMSEKKICDGHFSEKLLEEKVVVTKIQESPNYYLRYAKTFSISKTDIGPLMNSSTNSLSNKHMKCVAY